MSEYASRGPAPSYSSSSSSVAIVHAERGPRANPGAEQARRVVMGLEIELVAVGRAIEAVRAAHAANDVARWQQARRELDRQLGSMRTSHDRSQERTREATPETTRRLDALARDLDQHATTAATLEPPRGWTPVTRESTLVGALEAASESTAHAESLEAELARLSPAESRHLISRARVARPDDPVAQILQRFTPAAHDSILEYLGDAPHRALARQRHARRAATLPERPAPDEPLRRLLDTGDLAAIATVDSATRNGFADRLERYRPGCGDELGATFARRDRGTRLALLDVLRAGSQPLPESIKSDLEAAAGRSLGHVELHTGVHGDAVANAHGARAVAIGSEIFVADGHFAPTTDVGRELLAHEVSHVLQAGLSSSGSAAGAEHEADELAASFRKLGASARLAPSIGVAAASAMRAPATHAVSDVLTAQFGTANLTAAEYLRINNATVRTELVAFLESRPLTTGAQTHFTAGRTHFIETLFAAFDADPPEAQVKRLRDWLAPDDVVAIVDRNRALFEATKGPAAWQPTVAIAVASALEPKLARALERMADQLVTIAAKHRAVSPASFVPGSHLEEQVVLAMVGRGAPTVRVADGKLSTRETALDHAHAITALHWQGANGGPWNAVRVEPEDANVESVANKVLGSPAEASRIRQTGRFFLIPEDVAAHIPEASAHRGSVSSPLAFGPLASIVERDELAPLVGANVAAPALATLEQAWHDIHDQLTAIGAVVHPWHLDGELTPTIERHGRHHDDLTMLHGRDASMRGELFAKQQALLGSVAGLIAAILPTVPLTPDLPYVRKVVSGPRLVLEKLVHAASLSHLPATAPALVDEAIATQRGLTPSTLEAMLAEAITKIEVARELGVQALGARGNSTKAFGAPLLERAAVLRMRVAKLGDSEHEVSALFQDVDALRFDATIVSEVGELGALFTTLDELEGDGWVLMGQVGSYKSDITSSDNRIGRLETDRREAMHLRQELNAIHREWLAIEATSRAVAAGVESKGGSDAEQQARAIVQPKLEAIKAKLAKLGGDEAIRTFLTDAYENISDAESKARLMKLAAMIGVAMLAAATGGAAAGFAEGFIGSTAAGIVGATVETTVFTAVQARLEGEPVLQAFVKNGLGNLITFGAMRLSKVAVRATRFVKAVTSGAEATRAAVMLAKTTELSAELLVSQGMMIAQAEFESLRATGHTASLAELEASAVQGMAMMVGARIGQHLVADHLPTMRALGAHGREVLDRVRGAASKAELGDAAAAIEALREHREFENVLAARVTELEKMSDDQLAELGVSRDKLATIAKARTTADRELAGLERGTLIAQLGLHTVFPGRVYAGDAHTVDAVVAAYRNLGYLVEQSPKGYRLTKAQEPIIDLYIHVGAKPPRMRDVIAEHVDVIEGHRNAIRPKAHVVDQKQIDRQIRDGHAGSDLHNHFMGNVAAERFRDELAASGDSMKAGQVSAWEPLLDKIIALDGGELAHAYGDEKITERGSSGDAIRNALTSREAIDDKKAALSKSTDTATADKLRKQIDELARSAVQKALAASDVTDFNSSYEIRDKLIQGFYGAAERKQILGDGTIATRKERLLEHFKGRKTMEQRVLRAAELEAKPTLNAAESTQLAALKRLISEQFGYDRYCQDTLIALAREGITYTEQSNSIAKLNKRFDEGQLDWARARAKAEHPDLAAALDTLVVKHLAMTNTASFGERDAPDQSDIKSRPRLSDAGFEQEVTDAVALMGRSDVVGVDIAGMEHFRFDAVGAKRFEELYDQLAARALTTHKRFVFRPHVGEGANDMIAGEPFARDHSRQVTKDKSKLNSDARAQQNIGTWLDVLDRIASRPENRKYNGALPPEVIVRFGHATHATPAQAARIAKLGVIVEVNLGSNHASGASPRNKPEAGHDDQVRRDEPVTFDEDRASPEEIGDHSLGTLIFYQAEVVISTDGLAVMDTHVSTEYDSALRLIDAVQRDKRTVSIRTEDAIEMNRDGGHVPLNEIELQRASGAIDVTYSQMSTRMKERFTLAYRRFFEVSNRYLAQRPQSPNATGAR